VFLAQADVCDIVHCSLGQVIESYDSPGLMPAQWCATTHWSVVVAAGNCRSDVAQKALTTLCRTYWYPLYAYVRSRGYGPEDAQDLTQGFFLQLLERNSVGRADRQRGKFRFFLLGGLKKFISDEKDKATALKRGGGQKAVSFDAQTAEDRFQLEPVDTLSPDRIFERRWALTLLDQTIFQLRSEYIASEKRQLFEALEGFLTGADDLPSYAEVAAGLNLSESAVKSALHRLRQRHKEVLREQIAQTVTTAAEIEEEIRYLISVLQS
jgi:RNA polymerase sigma-70 factor (ECF subfamily)